MVRSVERIGVIKICTTRRHYRLLLLLDSDTRERRRGEVTVGLDELVMGYLLDATSACEPPKCALKLVMRHHKFHPRVHVPNDARQILRVLARVASDRFKM